jgi:hypothetical protein
MKAYSHCRSNALGQIIIEVYDNGGVQLRLIMKVYSNGGALLRLIKSTGKVTRELTKVINDRIELVKCSQVGRRPRALFENFDRDAQPS